MNEPTKFELIPTGEATAMLPVGRGRPITVIGTDAIRAGFDDKALQQAPKMSARRSHTGKWS